MTHSMSMPKNRTAIYVPSKSATKGDLPHETFVEKTAIFLSRLFGGATASPVTGYWMSGNGELVKEQTTIVYAFGNPDDIEENYDELLDFCAGLKDSMGQESIMCEFDTNVVFV